MITRLIPAAALALLLGNLAIGCEDAENLISCADVCEKYKSCLDEDYDVTSCTTSCEDTANDNADRQKQLDDCHACIEDRSCGGAVFSCTTECATVIAAAS